RISFSWFVTYEDIATGGPGPRTGGQSAYLGIRRGAGRRGRSARRRRRNRGLAHAVRPQQGRVRKACQEIQQRTKRSQRRIARLPHRTGAAASGGRCAEEKEGAQPDSAVR